MIRRESCTPSGTAQVSPEEVAHIGAGVEEDADEGSETEQPQDYGYENDA